MYDNKGQSSRFINIVQLYTYVIKGKYKNTVIKTIYQNYIAYF